MGPRSETGDEKRSRVWLCHVMRFLQNLGTEGVSRDISNFCISKLLIQFDLQRAERVDVGLGGCAAQVNVNAGTLPAQRAESWGQSSVGT